jgi:hypothetical protein
MNRQQHPDDAKAHARQVYEAHGSRRAAEATGISRRTLNAWAKAGNWQPPGKCPHLRVAPDANARSGQAKAVATPLAAHAGWQPHRLLQRLTVELWAQLDALAAAREAGKARDARDLAVVVGVLTDKALVLAKQTGSQGGQDAATSVARIRELVDGITARVAGDA